MRLLNEKTRLVTYGRIYDLHKLCPTGREKREILEALGYQEKKGLEMRGFVRRHYDLLMEGIMTIISCLRVSHFHEMRNGETYPGRPTGRFRGFWLGTHSRYLDEVWYLL